MLAALLRSFNALEFLKLHNCESQVLNRLRSPAIPAFVTDNRADRKLFPLWKAFCI